MSARSTDLFQGPASGRAATVAVDPADVVVGQPDEPDRSAAPGPSGERLLLASVLTAAGAIHLAIAPVHADSTGRQAAAFAAAGVLQLGVAGWTLVSRRRAAVLGAAALGVVTLAAWSWSRSQALPFELGGPEPAGLADTWCAGFEAAGVVLSAVVLRRGRRPGFLTIGAAVPLVAFVAVAAGAVVAAPSTAEHGGHGPDAHGTAAGAAGHDHAAGASCPEAGAAEPVTEVPLQFPAPRLDAVHAAALRALAATSDPLQCGAIAAASDGHGHGDAAAATAEATPLAAEEAARFDAQWAAATGAAAGLATPEQAAAVGYVKASPQVPGVGTHWIDWTLVDDPFDPARPSMLLFDERPGRPAALAGFSYWNRSAPGAPDGFAGPEDQWHQHAGLCFVDGWLFQEGVPSADACGGDWLAGDDLWMLHAWVVADRPNPAGRFAGRHEALCPGDLEAVADALTCNPVGN